MAVPLLDITARDLAEHGRLRGSQAIGEGWVAIMLVLTAGVTAAQTRRG